MNRAACEEEEKELEREFVQALILAPPCSLGNTAATAASSPSLQKRPKFAAVTCPLWGSRACVIKAFY